MNRRLCYCLFAIQLSQASHCNLSPTVLDHFGSLLELYDEQLQAYRPCVMLWTYLSHGQWHLCNWWMATDFRWSLCCDLLIHLKLGWVYPMQTNLPSRLEHCSSFLISIFQYLFSLPFSYSEIVSLNSSELASIILTVLEAWASSEAAKEVAL